MRTPTVLAVLSALFIAACGSPRPATATTPLAHVQDEPAPRPLARTPRSLDEALAAQGLRRFEPTVASRAMSHSFPDVAARAEGRRLTLHVSAGWNQSQPLFARRANGAVVLVEPRPDVVVDRHVPGGCRGFVGGRAWFETVVYELPEDARYEGSLAVHWEEHTEVIDWTDTEPDGSPCPPPAID